MLYTSPTHAPSNLSDFAVFHSDCESVYSITGGQSVRLLPGLKRRERGGVCSSLHLAISVPIREEHAKGECVARDGYVCMLVEQLERERSGNSGLYTGDACAGRFGARQIGLVGDQA